MLVYQRVTIRKSWEHPIFDGEFWPAWGHAHSSPCTARAARAACAANAQQADAKSWWRAEEWRKGHATFWWWSRREDLRGRVTWEWKCGWKIPDNWRFKWQILNCQVWLPDGMFLFDHSYLEWWSPLPNHLVRGSWNQRHPNSMLW